MSGHRPPPRLQKSLSIRRDETRSPTEVLVQMGFSKERAEKAIAATGDRGPQLATDWLISHVNDPHLDDATPREYMLYLCPGGALKEQLQTYYDKSLTTCGWNGFHSYFPHITLCSVFSVPNNKTGIVKRALRNLEPKLNKPPGKLQLDFFSQPNYIGLFLTETYYKYFKDIVIQFAQEMKQHGIEMEATKNQLHISLAYQFSGDHHDKLQELARKIDPKADCQWEFRVYSRDPRMGKSEVRRVIKAYKGDLEDELDLIMGDFVVMDTNESARSQDGWYNGMSWLTGTKGMFPGNFTQRTAETWTWAMHGSHPLGLQSAPQSAPQSTTPSAPQSTTPSAPQVTNGVAEGATGGGAELYDRLFTPDDLYAKVNKKSKTPEIKRKSPVPRKLYVMRHGERMDFVFGRDWCDKCFDDNGNYKATDLNMPSTVRKRVGNYLDYCKDAPLTALGKFQAFLTGEALRQANITFQHVYVSSSLRCLETVSTVLKSIGINPVIRVEPGLFEWLGWYQLGLPKFFTPAELKGHGFNIDLSYVPAMPIQKYNMEEDIAGYYKRSGDATRHILRRHQEEGGDVLIVGHAGSLEVCTRQVLGYQPRSDQHFREMCSKVPYCAMFSCQEDPVTRKWTVLDNPIPQLTHGQQKTANVKRMLYPPS